MTVEETEKYIGSVMTMIDSFRYQLCDDCGEDLDMHSIGPGPFRLPLIHCLALSEED